MNPVVHWELFATDAPALGAFYAALFGWRTEAMPEIGHVLIDTSAGGGINGGILTTHDGMFYVSVDDLDAALDQVHQSGGRTTLPPLEEIVTFAQFADPEGNIVGLLRRGDESPVSDGDAPAICRFRIGAIDPAALAEFYAGVFGWRVRLTDVRGAEHASFEVDTGPGGIAGVLGVASPGAQAVMFYASVAEPDRYLSRARALGALSKIGAERATGTGESPRITDPAGHVLGLVSSSGPPRVLAGTRGGPPG